MKAGVDSKASMTRRGFLSAATTVVGANLLLASAPTKADAIETRGSATGSFENFTFHGISGTMHNGFSWVPYSYITNTGAISSANHTYGVGAMQGYLSIKGPQRTIAEGYFTNTSAGRTVSVSLTTYDVNGGDGGYFYGDFYPSLFVAGSGFQAIGPHTSVSCSMYSRTNAPALPQSAQIYTLAGIRMVARTGDSGVDGYVRCSDLVPPNFESPEACLDFYRTHDSIQVTVYDEDGIAPIDIRSIPCHIV